MKLCSIILMPIPVWPSGSISSLMTLPLIAASLPSTGPLGRRTTRLSTAENFIRRGIRRYRPDALMLSSRQSKLNG